MSRSQGSAEELPSFGMSEYWNNPEQVAELMRTISSPQNPSSDVPVASTSPDDVQGLAHHRSLSSEETLGNNVYLSRGVAPEETVGVEAIQDPSAMIEEVIIEDDPTIYTGDDGQCSDNSNTLLWDSDMSDLVDLKPKLQPNLVVQPCKYQRFRYPSERPDKKKPRQYEMEEDKRVLADVSIENYEGMAKIICFCVNEDGLMHPFFLYGDSCTSGVYAQKASFGRRSPKFRITRVSVTTPKQKDYKERLLEHYNYLMTKHLSALDISVKKMDTTKGVPNKHVVQLLVVALLEDNSVLRRQTESIQNKKEGEEFLIHRITPCSGPCNPPATDSSTVSIIVTDKTAFPKEIGVRIRDKDSSDGRAWEKMLDEKSLTIIKKAVVEFQLPQYKNPDSVSDVEVEITLIDLKEKRETEACIFTYKGSDAETGLHQKRKKAKLNTDFLQSQTLVGEAAEASMASYRKTPLAAKRRNQYSGPECQQPSGSEISVQASRESVPFQNYQGSSNNQQPQSAIVTSSNSSFSFSEIKSTMAFSGSSSSTTMAVQPQIKQQQHFAQQMLQQQSWPKQSSLPQNQQQQNQQQLNQQQQQQLVGANDNSDLQNVVLDENLLQFLNLPKLPDNYQYAVIDGQIIVVKNDEQNIENIGGQNVVVQAVSPQHPSDDNHDETATTAPTAAFMQDQQQLLQQQLLQQQLLQQQLLQQQQVSPGLSQVGATCSQGDQLIPSTVEQVLEATPQTEDRNQQILSIISKDLTSRIEKGTQQQVLLDQNEQPPQQQDMQQLPVQQQQILMQILQQQLLLQQQQQQEQPSPLQYQSSVNLDDDDDLECDSIDVPMTVASLTSMRLDHCYDSHADIQVDRETATDAWDMVDP